ncbi:hypothetical protein CPB86DRAFT_779391 [Serendipita vermifera]|nr:hypothetical protein CPB86DRAFT_779391 [Serendipita vermifera]
MILSRVCFSIKPHVDERGGVLIKSPNPLRGRTKRHKAISISLAMEPHNFYYNGLNTPTHDGYGRWTIEHIPQAYQNDANADIDTVYYAHSQPDTHSGYLPPTAPPFPHPILLLPFVPYSTGNRPLTFVYSWIIIRIIYL